MFEQINYDYTFKINEVFMYCPVCNCPSCLEYRKQEKQLQYHHLYMQPDVDKTLAKVNKLIGDTDA